MKAKKNSSIKNVQDNTLDLLESDCLESVARQLLSRVLASTDDDNLYCFRNAEEEASDRFEHVKGLSREEAFALLRSRVSLIGRGKQLDRRTARLEKQVGIITRAMLTGYCIECRYNNRVRTLMPYGLVVREPKIYLVAAEYNSCTTSKAPDAKAAGHQSQETQSQETVRLKHFLCNRILELRQSEVPSTVPDDFCIEEYTCSGAMEIPIASLSSALDDRFDLVLRLNDPRSDNMLRDIEEFPLDKKQALIKEGIGGDYLLKIPNQTANVALVNWIFARQDRVEVLKPLPLRQYVIAKLHNTAQRYLGGATDLLDTGIKAEPFGDASTGELVADNVPRQSRYRLRSENNDVVSNMIFTLLQNVSINRQVREAVRDRGLLDYFPAGLRRLGKSGALPEFSKAVKGVKTKPCTALSFDQSDPFTINSEYIGRTLDLSDSELGVFRLAVLINHHNPLQQAVSLCFPDFSSDDFYNVIRLLLGYSYEVSEYCLAEDQALRTSGLLSTRRHGVFEVIDLIEMSSSLVAATFREAENVGDLFKSMADVSPLSNIEEADIEHLSDPFANIQRLVRGACERQEKGVNVLLWGPPGTGKTQFARYILQSLAKNAFEVKVTGTRGMPLEEAQRVSAYNLCQSMLKGSADSAVIFDEAENVLIPQIFSRDFSKAFMNQVLENNHVPTIWISNHVEQADPAYLRRFTYVAEVPNLTQDVKRRIANRILCDIPINGVLLEDFLQRQEVGPALLGKLKRATEISDLSAADDVGQLALSIVQGDLAALGAPPLVLTESANSPLMPELSYDAKMINSDRALSGFVQKAKAGNSARLLLFGAPGTGKTAWAKYLAKEIGKTAHVYTPADIKGKYVGESEQAVRDAFELSIKENSVLIFDEVDSYLRSRQSADRNHEVDLVNQFLTSMESYNGMLVCSTNIVDIIDQAALRRFDIKAELKYLRTSQCVELFKQCAGLLGMTLCHEEIDSISSRLPNEVLAPGDFAVVLRQAFLGGDEVTFEELYALLMAEHKFRQGSVVGNMGFC